MTHASGDDWTPGQPVRVETKAVGPIEVDCSKWDADIPEDKWFQKSGVSSDFRQAGSNLN